MASTTANVVSTAGDAMLSVADPSPTNTGKLVNGTFALPQPLQVKAASAGGTGRRSARSAARPLPRRSLTYAAPSLNDAVTIDVQAARSAARTPCAPAPTARR